jgi:hypothetical protein
MRTNNTVSNCAFNVNVVRPCTQAFHAKCDRTGPTMTLIKLKNARIAAYAMHSWWGGAD